MQDGDPDIGLEISVDSHTSPSSHAGDQSNSGNSKSVPVWNHEQIHCYNGSTIHEI